MKVDPGNRLVDNALEADWKDKLRLHSEAATDYEKRSQEQSTVLNETAGRQIIDLAARFSSAPLLPQRLTRLYPTFNALPPHVHGPPVNTPTCPSIRSSSLPKSIPIPEQGPPQS